MDKQISKVVNDNNGALSNEVRSILKSEGKSDKQNGFVAPKTSNIKRVVMRKILRRVDSIEEGWGRKY